jgi:hypothetical protein
MPIYSRNDMNALIGHCFGTYLDGIDALFSDVINELIPGAAVVPDLDPSHLPFTLQSIRECSGEGFQIGAADVRSNPALQDVLREE